MAAVRKQHLADTYESIAPFLDERQRRWLGVQARALGRGGISAVQTAARREDGGTREPRQAPRHSDPCSLRCKLVEVWSASSGNKPSIEVVDEILTKANRQTSSDARH